MPAVAHRPLCSYPFTVLVFEWFPMVPFENRKNSVARQSTPGRLLFRLKNNPENDTLTGKQKKPFYTFSL